MYSDNTDHDFEYTDYTEPNSSWVDGVYYNDNNKSLAVDLRDDVYAYTNVDKEDYIKFRTADSTGGYYNTEFKKKYGPAEYLGYIHDLYFDHVSLTPVATAGTPKDLTEPTKEYSLNSFSASNVGTATISSDRLNVSDATKEYALKTPAPVQRASSAGDYKVEVVYALNGHNNEHVFTTEADDVSDALDELSDNLKVMGLSGRALRAVVHFE